MDFFSVLGSKTMLVVNQNVGEFFWPINLGSEASFEQEGEVPFFWQPSNESMRILEKMLDNNISYIIDKYIYIYRGVSVVLFLLFRLRRLRAFALWKPIGPISVSSHYNG